VHLTLGILRTSQAVFYAFSFFWLDGFAVPTPAQVTQTVGWLRAKQKERQIVLIQSKVVTQGENMEIFNGIRGHFALLIDKPMETPADLKPFVIKSVSTKRGEWQIVLEISTGNTEKVYISDILRVYAFIVDATHPLTQTEVHKYAEKNCLANRTSYVIPLLATFSDIKIKSEPELTIQFIPTLKT